MCLLGLEIKFLSGIKKIQSSQYPACCALCFQDKDTPLYKAIIKTHRYNPTNLLGHIKHKHTKEEAPECFRMVENENIKVTTDDEGTAATRVSSVASKPGKISHYYKASSKANAVKEVHTLLYRFLNRAAIPIMHGTNKDLSKLLCFVCQNAKFLEVGMDQNFKIGRVKYNSLQVESFSRTVNVISKLVEHSREYYRTCCSQQVPFISVAHDIWDSKDSDWLGVSIHFVVPFCWCTVAAPIAFKKVTTKKAKDVAFSTLQALAR